MPKIAFEVTVKDAAVVADEVCGVEENWDFGILGVRMGF